VSRATFSQLRWMLNAHFLTGKRSRSTDNALINFTPVIGSGHSSRDNSYTTFYSFYILSIRNTNILNPTFSILLALLYSVY